MGSAQSPGLMNCCDPDSPVTSKDSNVPLPCPIKIITPAPQVPVQLSCPACTRLSSSKAEHTAQLCHTAVKRVTIAIPRLICLQKKSSVTFCVRLLGGGEPCL